MPLIPARQNGAASLSVTFIQWRSDMQITDADRAWGKAIPDYIQNQDDKLPPVGRFNYGQKLFFWGIFYGLILLLLSGVVLWYTEARFRGASDSCAMLRF
jgi:cytochrome b subunit of formate dehydrogenase